MSRTMADDGDSDGVSIGGILIALLENKWLILLIVLAGTLIGLFASFVIQPEYRAAGMLQVEEKATAPFSALKEIGPLLGLNGDTTVAAEQEILNSRMVLERVINKQKLNISAEPKYFPIIGRALARGYDGEGIKDSLLGLDSYAWGGETIAVSSFDVPKDMLDERHTLLFKGDARFEVYGRDDEVVLDGVVGSLATKANYSIFVSTLNARPGTKFLLIRMSADEALAALNRNYSIRERGKKSGLLDIAYKGTDPTLIGVVLQDIMNTYVRQNIERRSAEAENTLGFLEKQLPNLKKELDAAEAEYNKYRQSRGSLDLNIETQSVLTSIVEVDNQIVALKQEKDELRQYFTPEHPRLIAVDSKLEKLKARRAQFDGDIARLPDTQQTVLRLARDVEVYTTLYTSLVNTAQQLRVSKAGTVGDVRIIDNATVTNKPVGYKPIAFVAIGGFMGLIAAFIFVWIRTSMRVVVESPDEIEEKLGLPVYATIPHSNLENGIGKASQKASNETALLAINYPDDDAVESLRSLRTTIHFALLDSNKNSLLITGSAPGLGKSFVSKNLGAVLAQAGKRVLLVDADMRKGHIHKEFGLKRNVGLSDFIVGTASVEEIVKPTVVPNLWVVTTGQIPPNPSELLMNLRFEELLDKFSHSFDTVIVDAPPILAVSDAVIIGRHVGATVLVARYGVHPIAELAQAIKRLRQGGVEVKGFIFNDLDTTRQRYRYGYEGYVYRYSYKN